MATTVIQNSCLAGALSGLMAGRFMGSVTAADYQEVVDAAAAIADEFITVNTGSGAALADADNANIGAVVQSAAFAAVFQTGAVSDTATDYLKVARQIYGASKQALASLV
jgi:hypothetical protein